ncbi:MAG: 4Fe-4S binding protein [Clostridiales bacterium]|nr:4Fe-4S binding protein [Clostridiales bacterium]
MSSFKHSVSLLRDKCKGCTNCLKRCPTEAIRIRDGHSHIDDERCIDCGQCIRVCPYNAKKASSDKLAMFSHYKYKIALPAPALYGQFERLEDIDYIISGLYACGFDEVMEVARAAELVSSYTRSYLQREDIKKPVISSACPVVCRLISMRFPFLADNLLPILPPIELAAKLAKEETLALHPELKETDICVLFISPCPAKVSYVKNPIGIEKSAVDGVLSISDIYFELVSVMNHLDSVEHSSKTGIIGIGWAGSGGEASALLNDKYLAADGIDEVINVLEEIENENLSGLEFIELNACHGGCVGGTLNVENPFIAKARLTSLKRYLPVSPNHSARNGGTFIPDDFFWEKPLAYQPVAKLSDDRAKAMAIMNKIQQVNEAFPQLDCGACGSPTCRALAEDIVMDGGDVSQCIFILKEKYRKLSHTAKQTGAKEADDDGS